MLSLEALLPISSLADFRKNQHFYQPEDRSQAVYMLIKGRVHLYRINPDGKKRRRLSSTESVDFRIQMIHEATRRNTKNFSGLRASSCGFVDHLNLGMA
jgi:hypothetical protein